MRCQFFPPDYKCEKCGFVAKKRDGSFIPDLVKTCSHKECGCCIPPPTGSGICCNPFLVNSGSCVVASVEECRNIGRFFVTGVSSCLPGICSPPTGACHMSLRTRTIATSYSIYHCFKTSIRRR